MGEYVQEIKDVVWAAKLGHVSWLSVCDKPWWMIFGSRTKMYRSHDDGKMWHQIIAPGETMCVQPEVARALRQMYLASAPSDPPTDSKGG
jgi:hypothetical protein